MAAIVPAAASRRLLSLDGRARRRLLSNFCNGAACMTHGVRILVSLLMLFAARTPAAEPHWIGTWATSAQAVMPGRLETFDDQTIRLIVHVSVGGARVRIRLSNAF